MTDINKKEYVNLHLHTEFSALDGFARIDDMKDDKGNVLMQGITSRLKELGQTHCAITDHASLSAIQPAYNSFKKAGIQLMPGCEFYIVPDMKNKKGMQNHLVVIAKNEKGWENILKMNYIAYEQGSKMLYDRQVGRIEMSVLEKHTEGLLVSSACLAGIPAWFSNSDRYDEAVDHVKQMKKLFPESYYIEVQGVDYYGMLDSSARTSEVDRDWIEMQATDQKAANDKLIDMAEKLKVPIVCTTDAHYVRPEDRDSHLLMLAVQSKTSIETPAFGAVGRGGRLAFEATPMISTDDLVKMFTEKDSGFNGYAEDQVREWVKNTQLAAAQCEPADYLAPSGYKIPLFPVEQSEDYQNFIKWRKGLEQEEIDNILEQNSNFLKNRLIKD